MASLDLGFVCLRNWHRHLTIQIFWGGSGLRRILLYLPQIINGKVERISYNTNALMTRCKNTNTKHAHWRCKMAKDVMEAWLSPPPKVTLKWWIIWGEKSVLRDYLNFTTGFLCASFLMHLRFLVIFKTFFSTNTNTSSTQIQIQLQIFLDVPALPRHPQHLICLAQHMSLSNKQKQYIWACQTND